MYNLKITLRRLFKDKAFTGINVFGLIIGISSFLVLFIYVSNEKSFDTHFKGHENIYRVTSIPEGRGNAQWARSLGFIHKASDDIPEVESATQFSHCAVGTISIAEKSIEQKDIMSVDQGFVEMFEVEAQVGNLAELNKPNTVFVSEEFAKRHFNGVNPVGQVISIDALQYVRNVGDYEIRGIVKNTHPKTHFNYELLLSQKGGLQDRYEQLPNRKIQWIYNHFKLGQDTKPQQVAEKIKSFWD